MVSFRRLVLALAILALACPTPGQDARRRPQPPGWQDQINEVFGELIEAVSFAPFYDVAAMLGIDTSPHRILDGGKPSTRRIELVHPGSRFEFAAFSPTGRRVFAADQTHAIHVFSLFRASWRIANAQAPDPLLAVLKGHTGPIRAFAVFPDAGGRVDQTDDFYRRTEIVSGSDDGTARIWRLCTPDEEDEGRHAEAPAQPVERTARHVLQHGAPVTAVAYSSTGRWLATGGSDGRVLLWDEQCKQVREFGPVQGGITGLTFDGDADILVAFGAGAAQQRNRFAVATGQSGTAPAAPAGPTKAHLAKSVLPNGNGANLELVSGEVLALGGHSGTVRGAADSFDHTRALTWSDDGSVGVHEWLVRGPTGKVAEVAVPFVVLWLVIAAVLFTLFFRFVNLRLFVHAIRCVRGKYSDPKDVGEVSHFQALSAALSATVGLGNIAGVAVAVMVGGPGATFWMVIAGLLGMTLKFTECTLGQRFRKIDAQGAVSGGPMHYLKDGIAQRWPALAPLGGALAMIFSVFCIGGSIAGGNAFQVNQSLGILRGQVPFFDHHPWVYGLLMAFFTAIVIIGGIKSIAKVADKIVPLMCGIYVLSALVVILLHLDQVPAAMARIFSSALSGDAVYGGAIGALIMGFRRAAFSNEAGVGSASIAHSAAKTPFAVREGIVALLEPFIDTVIVCTMTALVIGITGVYNAPEHAEIIAATNGAALTAEAFKSVGAFRSWFPWLLMVAVTLFAYSTMISWSYYGERCATNLFGPKASLPFKLLFLTFTVLGSIVTATNVLEFGDLMILLMAFPNILGLYLLGGYVKVDLSTYEQKLKSGEIQAYR